jgi:elongation factor P--(R)-beta-lysine ligase
MPALETWQLYALAIAKPRVALHHPEFTMLEWYRASEPCKTLMDDCAELLRVA